jgi:hypothetical protein
MRTYIDSKGNKHYFSDNYDSFIRMPIYHREDGPAVEFTNGDKYWYINGKLHREDGPAMEFNDGRKGWYIKGESYTEEQYYRIILKYKWVKFIKDRQ